nr:hypothetical protein [Tanacetum cinerariifolium]
QSPRLDPRYSFAADVLDPLQTIVQRVYKLEKDVKELKQINHSSVILATIRSQLPSAANEYLGSSLGDWYSRKHTNKLKQELKQQESQNGSLEIIKIKQEHASKQKWLKKDLTAGSDQGKDKKNPRKDTQPSKKSSASKESSKGNTPPKSSKSGKHVTTKEPDKEHVHDMSLHVEENIVDEMGNADEHPDGEAAPKNDWFKQPLRPPTPDREWNQCQVINDQPKQTWFNDLVSILKLQLDDLDDLSEEETILDSLLGYVGLHTHQFSLSNLRLPIPPFICKVLNYFKVHISRVNPFGLVKLTTFAIMCKSYGGEPYVELLRSFLNLGHAEMDIKSFMVGGVDGELKFLLAEDVNEGQNSSSAKSMNNDDQMIEATPISSVYPLNIVENVANSDDSSFGEDEQTLASLFLPPHPKVSKKVKIICKRKVASGAPEKALPLKNAYPGLTYAIRARDLDKDRAYAELERMCNKALQDLDKNLLVSDMRAEIKALQGQVDGLYSELLKKVAAMEEPFVLEKISGYRSLSKEESASYSASLLVVSNSNLNAYVYSFRYGLAPIRPALEPSELEAPSMNSFDVLFGSGSFLLNSLLFASLFSEADKAFQRMNECLESLPMMVIPTKGETLTMYLATSEENVSAALMAERGKKQILIYFVSQTLHGAELKCVELYGYMDCRHHDPHLLHSNSSKQYFYGESNFTITNMSVFVTAMGPSTIVTSNGISSKGHDCSPEKLTRGVFEFTRRDLINGFSFKKKCSYISSHELPPSRYALFTFLPDMYTLIMTGSDEPTFERGGKVISSIHH